MAQITFKSINNETYQKNITALKQLNPEFANKLSISKNPPWLEFINDNKNFLFDQL